MSFLFLPVFAQISLSLPNKSAIEQSPAAKPIAPDIEFEQVINKSYQPHQPYSTSSKTFEFNSTDCINSSDCPTSIELSTTADNLNFELTQLLEPSQVDSPLEDCQQNQCSYDALGLIEANRMNPISTVEHPSTDLVANQSISCQSDQSNLNCDSILIELNSSTTAVKIVAQTRDDSTEQLEFTIPTNSDQIGTPVESINVVEVMADEQQYDDRQQIITAQGNVVMRYGGAVLTAQRLEINLPDGLAVAQGEVVLDRGQQTFRGDRFEYYFAQDLGSIINASGEIYFPSAGSDFTPSLPSDEITPSIPTQPLNAELFANQPLQRITTTDGYQFAVGDVEKLAQAQGLPSFETGGQINRIRFEAEKIDFDADGWQAYEVSITNDPFSPPELEVRADTAVFRNVEPLVDELVTTNSRVVFDDNLSLPIFQDRLTFDRRPTDPGLFSIAIDGRDRGGVYLERGYTLYSSETTSWKVSPQYLLQRSVGLGSEDEDDDDENTGGFSPDAFGLESQFISQLNPRTDIEALLSFSSLDVTDLADDFRARLQLERRLGNIEKPHELRLEYTYRDRVFNGSLGFQTVDSSVGGVIVSPRYEIGTTGIQYSYQGSIQYITADTDQPELIDDPLDFEDPVSLMRYQGAISFNKDFDLWLSTTLPPTEEEGLRYTSKPVQPYLQFVTGVTAVSTFYGSGDTQNSLLGKVGIRGQLGRFSRPWFDYTGFRVTYEQAIIDGESPFRFDRFEDTSILSFGITQQLYGPFLFGFRTSISLDESEDISTDYFLEYSRRSYSVRFRYNSELQLGSIDFRISDFNWVGDPQPFDGVSGDRPVIQGVER